MAFIQSALQKGFEVSTNELINTSSLGYRLRIRKRHNLLKFLYLVSKLLMFSLKSGHWFSVARKKIMSLHVFTGIKELCIKLSMYLS